MLHSLGVFAWKNPSVTGVLEAKQVFRRKCLNVRNSRHQVLRLNEGRKCDGWNGNVRSFILHWCYFIDSSSFARKNHWDWNKYLLLITLRKVLRMSKKALREKVFRKVWTYGSNLYRFAIRFEESGVESWRRFLAEYEGIEFFAEQSRRCYINELR